jgi:hypothetical protein
MFLGTADANVLGNDLFDITLRIDSVSDGKDKYVVHTQQDFERLAQIIRDDAHQQWNSPQFVTLRQTNPEQAKFQVEQFMSEHQQIVIRQETVDSPGHTRSEDKKLYVKEVRLAESWLFETEMYQRLQYFENLEFTHDYDQDADLISDVTVRLEEHRSFCETHWTNLQNLDLLFASWYCSAQADILFAQWLDTFPLIHQFEEHRFNQALRDRVESFTTPRYVDAIDNMNKIVLIAEKSGANSPWVDKAKAAKEMYGARAVKEE